jgi:hypothetical protein
MLDYLTLYKRHRRSKFKDISRSKQEFEDTKGVIRSCKSKNDKQYQEQKKDKITNNDLQNITQ